MIDRFGTEDPGKPGIYVASAEEQKALAEALGDATSEWVKSNTPDDANEWVDKFAEEARAASEAHPMGSSDLEKTDCSTIQPWFDRFTQKG